MNDVYVVFDVQLSTMLDEQFYDICMIIITSVKEWGPTILKKYTIVVIRYT